MNLTVFSAETLPQSTTTKCDPRVSFTKTGMISFNQHACDLMGLQVGDRFALTQDEDNPQDWYVFKSPAGFPLKAKAKESGLKFNHTALRATILGCFDLDLDRTYNYGIAKTPTVLDKVKYWGILIA
jgi:hypothetical protein